VYFFLGRHDYTVPFQLSEKYFSMLICKQGKQLIWFENSAHILILEEPAKFINTLINKVKTETYPPDRK
jgi:proline iminopeptidase